MNIDIEKFELRAQGVFKESTFKRKILNLRNFAKFLKAKKLNFEEDPIKCIDEYLDYMRSKGLDPGTIRNAFYDIKSYLEIMRIPVDLTLVEKYLPRYTLEEADYLEVDEVKRLLEVAKPFYRALYAVMYAYARRPGEVLRLKRTDVDFENMKITFPILKKATDERATYDLEPWIAELLQQLERKSDRVFPISHQRLCKKFRRDCIKAGILKKVTPHVLRHSRITHLGQLGIDIVVIQKYIAKHSKLETTVRIYRHITREEIKKIPSAQEILQGNI